jgi:hypothetical protein
VGNRNLYMENSIRLDHVTALQGLSTPLLLFGQNSLLLKTIFVAATDNDFERLFARQRERGGEVEARRFTATNQSSTNRVDLLIL